MGLQTINYYVLALGKKSYSGNRKKEDPSQGATNKKTYLPTSRLTQSPICKESYLNRGWRKFTSLYYSSSSIPGWNLGVPFGKEGHTQSCCWLALRTAALWNKLLGRKIGIWGWSNTALAPSSHLGQVEGPPQNHNLCEVWRPLERLNHSPKIPVLLPSQTHLTKHVSQEISNNSGALPSVLHLILMVNLPRYTLLVPFHGWIS